MARYNRKEPENQRRRRLVILLTDAEYQRLERAAQHRRRKIGPVVRSAALAVAEVLGV